MKSHTLEEIRVAESAPPYRVLILEHSPQDIELVLLELKDAGLAVTPTITEDRDQFLRALRGEEFDIILADFRLPSWNGLDALEEVRAFGKDVPFVLVTGTLGEEAAVECIKQGVSDYVLKDHISRLPVAIRRALREKKLRDDAERAHTALAESEARVRTQFAELELLYRTAPVCLAVLDRNLRFVRVNEWMARNHGISPADHIGRSLYEIAPEIASESAVIYGRVLATGKPVLNVERTIKRTVPPFESRDYLASFHPVCSAEGEVVAACLVMVDITDRKNAEASLRRSEERNRDLVEHAIYGICRVSPDGTFLDANPAMIAMLGCTSFEEVQALNLGRDIFRYPEQHAQLLAACREHGKVFGTETDWRRRDGGIVAVRLHLRGISLAGMPDALEMIAEDVTELRAMERQLRQAQKFEAVGQLAGGIAHDFNNVVGAILGWAELGFEQSQASKPIQDRFEKIREQAERAAALTRELLAFARRQVLQPRAVDLNTVTNGLVSFLDKVIGRNIEIKVVASPLSAVKADPTQIEQVLMNLCLNARDAMQSGGRLLIETEMVELDESYCRFYPYVTPGVYAVLSVSDTGMGMDAETRERIFEPFFTTKPQGKGTGMGLATVYGIVKQHGGFIHVYSEPGHGSLFRVYLPAIEGAAAESASSPPPKLSLAEMRGSETVLLAEDHESIREMARQTLTGLGYQVLAASNGEEALRLCEQDAPALAVLDVVMPKIGGIATAKTLAERMPELPILFTSGYSQDADASVAADPDARYLQKPYSPTTLGRIVREILDEVAAKRDAT